PESGVRSPTKVVPFAAQVNLVVRIADEHLRLNGVGTGFVRADAILPKEHTVPEYNQSYDKL
ncbi:MAG: hypothetical protein J2P41_14105, partial [Blastocatellia bacterium]|nr:hypothetical protein [Blastocatellia bacterium]